MELFLVGIDGSFAFSEQSMTLDHGEQMIVMTDGVTEAENTRHEQLGFDWLLEHLQTINRPIDDRMVYDVVSRFYADAEPSDDIAILSITRK